MSADATVGGTLTADKLLYSNVYSSESDLPSASTYHGMFAHVHGTGKAYFSHSGTWHKLLDESTSATLSNTLTLSKPSGTGLSVTADTVLNGNVDINGNVGIGITGTATEKLEINGNIKAHDLTLTGDLTINGTTTTVNTTILTVKDQHIELGVVDSPTNDTANNGGIILKGLSDKKLTWVKSGSSGSWTSSEDFNIISGKNYQISGVDVLSHDGTNTNLSGGDIGIGTTTPTAKLDVAGDLKATSVTTPTGTINVLNVINSATSKSLTVSETVSVGGDVDIDGTLVANNQSHLIGDVGIGTTTPTAKLDVAGDLKATSVTTPTGSINVLNVINSATSKSLTVSETVSVGGSVDIDGILVSNNQSHLLGDVGIGTTTPTAKLDVAGDLKATSVTTPTGSINVLNVINSATSKSLTVSETVSVGGDVDIDGTLVANNQSHLLGDVGIGTDEPSEKLDVIGDIKTTGITADTLSVANASVNVFNVVNSATITSLNVTDSLSIDTDINLNSSKIVNVEDPVSAQDVATKAYVDNKAFASGSWNSSGNNYTSGNLDIGEESSIYTTKLNVNGNINATGKLNIQPGTQGIDNTILIDTKRDIDGWNPVQITQTYNSRFGGNLLFKTRNKNPILDSSYDYDLTPSTKMAIYSGGTVRIGGDIPNNLDSSTNKLEVEGNVNITGDINTTGKITAQSVVTTSDERLKENIKPIEKTNLQSVETVEYNFKADKDKKKRYGLIAQQLEKIDESLVYTDEDGTKGINYIDMIALLIKENQNLAKENQNLTKRMERIEKMLNI